MPFAGKRVTEAEKPIASCVIIGYAAEKKDISGIGAAFINFLITTSVNAIAPPRLSETTEGRAVRANRCCTHLTDAARQRLLSGSRAVHPCDKRNSTCCASKVSSHLQFVRGVTLSVDDHRAQSPGTRFRLESLCETCEETIAVVRKYHACETGTRQSQATGLQIDRVAKLFGAAKNFAAVSALIPVLPPRIVRTKLTVVGDESAATRYRRWLTSAPETFAPQFSFSVDS